MVRINWTKSAVEDLKNIALYIAKDSDDEAKIIIEKLLFKTQALKAHPLSGNTIDGIDDKTIRELTESRFRIFYKIVNPFQINILAVHETATTFNKRNTF